MRKFVLIAAMALVSASAQASEPRGLTLAVNDDPATSQPAPAPPVTPSDTPKYLARPSAVDARAAARQKMDLRQAAMLAEKKRHHVSLAARVIYALHRHGIYW